MSDGTKQSWIEAILEAWRRGVAGDVKAVFQAQHMMAEYELMPLDCGIDLEQYRRLSLEAWGHFVFHEGDLELYFGGGIPIHTANNLIAKFNFALLVGSADQLNRLAAYVHKHQLERQMAIILRSLRLKKPLGTNPPAVPAKKTAKKGSARSRVAR